LRCEISRELLEGKLPSPNDFRILREAVGGVPFLINQALVYALGGVAYGDRTVDAMGFVGPFSTQGSFGGTSVGWDVGGGLAAKIGPSSEVFIEGRWVDLVACPDGSV
jgi:opacity protein-like surface antigen